jgi:hypothetical protein
MGRPRHDDIRTNLDELMRLDLSGLPTPREFVHDFPNPIDPLIDATIRTEGAISTFACAIALTR